MKNFIITLGFVFFASIACQAQFIDSCSSCKDSDGTTTSVQIDGKTVMTVVIEDATGNIITQFESANPQIALNSIALPQGQYSVLIYRTRVLYAKFDLIK